MKKIIFTGGSGKFVKYLKNLILIKKIFISLPQKLLMLQIKKKWRIS